MAPIVYERRAEHFRAQGYIVIFADYLGRRGLIDVSELPAKMRYGFGTIGYDPRVAAAAREEIQRFLRPSRLPRGESPDASRRRAHGE